MGRTETYFIQSHPDKVNETISVYESFGWSVIGTQQITDDKGVDNVGMRHYETYTKLTLSRDVDIPNKAKLTKLQSEYESLINDVRRLQSYTPSLSPSMSKNGILVAAIGLIFLIGAPWKKLGLIIMGIGAVWTLISYLCYLPNKKSYESNTREINSKLTQATAILAEAKKL